MKKTTTNAGTICKIRMRAPLISVSRCTLARLLSFVSSSSNALLEFELFCGRFGRLGMLGSWSGLSGILCLSSLGLDNE